MAEIRYSLQVEIEKENVWMKKSFLFLMVVGTLSFFFGFAGTSPSAELKPPFSGEVNFGNYYAIVIGNNAYKHLPKLSTAVNDAKALAELLQKAYGFKVALLTDATRQQIIDALDDMRRTLTEQDNLLIYYAGHGWLDIEADRGFWLPVDAEENRRAGWLSNSDITDTARSTMAKHVLLVVDSCYSGTLTRGLSPQLDNPAVVRLAQKRARTVLTSGGLEPVTDTGTGGHSVFAKAFLDALKENNGVVDMSQLSSHVRYQVMLGAKQTPQYGDIRQTGHEGGDFLFVRRYTKEVFEFERVKETPPLRQEKPFPRDSELQTPLTHYNTGVEYGKKGQYEQAIEEFNKAIALDQNFGKAYVARGIAFFKSGNAAKAGEDFAEACNRDRESCKISAEFFGGKSLF